MTTSKTNSGNSSVHLNPIDYKAATPLPAHDDVSKKVEKVFKATISEGKLKLLASPRSGKRRSVLYQIWNKNTGEVYIGKTDQSFQRRLSQHSCKANSAENSSFTRFHDTLRKSPLDFRFGIVKLDESVSSPEQLCELERELIQSVALDKRLNSNLGGGGGTAVSALNSLASQSEAELFTTPKKYYPLKADENGLKFELTPSTKVSRNVIYTIQEKPTGRRYVGYTGQPLLKRLGEHCSKAKKPHSQKSLYHAMQQQPQDFQAGILAKDVPVESLPIVEADYIKKKDSIKHGFNQNKGGGGSSVSKN